MNRNRQFGLLLAGVLLVCVACGADGKRRASDGIGSVAAYSVQTEMTANDFKDATDAWQWILPATARPLLITTLGDAFVEMPDGRIQFLDTELGELVLVAKSRAEWEHKLELQENVETWFRPTFVQQLKRHRALDAGEVYSPIHPPVLGGKLTTENYTPSVWQAHLHVMGQIHRQVKDLPAGTKITKIHVDPW